MAKTNSTFVKFGKYKDKTFEWVSKNDPAYFVKIRELKFFRKYSSADLVRYQQVLNANIKTGAELIQSKSLDPNLIEKCLIHYYEKNSAEYVLEKLEQLKISPTTAKEYMKVVRKLYNNNIDQEKENLIQIHVNRYEDMYLRLNDKEVTQGKNWLRYEVFRYLQMINVLQAKEKILGIHSKIFKVQLNNYYQAKKIKSLPDLDFNQLTVEEKKKLIDLFDKCREQTEQFKIIPRIQSSQKNVLNIEEAEIIEAPIQKSSISEQKSTQEKPMLSLEDIKKQIQLKQAEKLNLKK